MEENPGRGLLFHQVMRVLCPQLEPFERMRRLAGNRIKRIGSAVEYCNGHQSEYFRPATPVRHLGKIVRPHEPDEIDARKTELQHLQRIYRVEGAGSRLDIEDPDVRMAGDRPRRLEPIGVRCHSLLRLQRILQRDQPPHLVELQETQRQKADVAMAFVCRVERAAEQPDPEAG